MKEQKPIENNLFPTSPRKGPFDFYVTSTQTGSLINDEHHAVIRLL
jgi:hypothetical protein